MKNKIRTTINALLARQRELTELRNIGGVTPKQDAEYVGNSRQLLVIRLTPKKTKRKTSAKRLRKTRQFASTPS